MIIVWFIMLNQWISSGNLRDKHLSDWWALQRCIPRMDKLTIEFLTIVLCTRGLLERHRTLSPLLKDTYYSRNGLLFVRARDVLDFRFLFFFTRTRTRSGIRFGIRWQDETESHHVCQKVKNVEIPQCQSEERKLKPEITLCKKCFVITKHFCTTHVHHHNVQ